MPNGLSGARLTPLRKARMMTVSRLATESGVSQATLSKVANGKTPMSEDVAEKVSLVLGVEPSYFALDFVELDTPTFYRSLTAATKMSRDSQAIRSEMADELVFILKQYLDLPLLSIPQEFSRQSLDMISDEEIEQAASETRSLWGLGNDPIPNLTGMAESNGLVVSMASFGVQSLDGLSRMGRDGTPIVLINTDLGSAFRWRFDLGHEIGHMVLHRLLDQATVNKSGTRSTMERQAHRFSSALLLPRDSFLDSLIGLTLNDLKAIKLEWGVSIQAMVRRLYDLEIISERQYTTDMTMISRKRWKTKEPLDDQLLPERPTLLRTCVTMCVEECSLDVHTIMSKAGIPEDIFEDLVGVHRGFVAQGGFGLPMHQGVKPKAEVIHFKQKRG